MKGVFPKMVEILQPGTSGDAEISHYQVSDHEACGASLRGMATSAGAIATLRVRGTLMMSDTPHERRTNFGVVRNSKGHVLIAGLGLGMICHAIAAKEEVSKITVLEKSQGVIDLVGPTLPDKVRTVCADVFEWKPPKGEKYDTIYFDIWPNICTDNLEEMARLHRKFARRKSSPDAWMDSWCKSMLKTRKRQEDRWRR